MCTEWTDSKIQEHNVVLSSCSSFARNIESGFSVVCCVLATEQKLFRLDFASDVDGSG